MIPFLGCRKGEGQLDGLQGFGGSEGEEVIDPWGQAEEEFSQCQG